MIPNQILESHLKRGYKLVTLPEMPPLFTMRDPYPVELLNCTHRPTRIYEDDTMHINKCTKCKFLYEVKH